MTLFTIDWRTDAGVRRVEVDAEVSEHGGVEVASVRNLAGGPLLRFSDFELREKLRLIDAVRSAAGVCAECSGVGKVVALQKTGRRIEEARSTCPSCGGSGRSRRSP